MHCDLQLPLHPFDQRERTFGLLASEPDPRTRDQHLQQLLNTTIEDTPQMQFMLDISRSTAVAYQHLLEKFLHILTNLVLIRRDAYLKNAHNSLDAYRLKNLRAAPISGQDLFERSLMQEYEQHLIGLGVKTGNQQSTRFHPYGKGKKKPRGRGRGAYQQGGYYPYYPVPPPQYIMPPQFYPQQQRGGFRGGHRGRGNRRGRGKSSGSNQNQQQPPNNDTLQSPPPLNPGQPLSTHSGHHWENNSYEPQKQFPLNRPYTERAKTLDTKSLPERAKTLSSSTPQEGVKTPCVQLVKVSVSSQENIKDLPVGGRLKWFINEWEKQGAHPFHLDLLRLGYRLPFREHPKLSRTPCIISSYSEVDKNNALSTSIQNLLTKNAIEKVNREDSLGLYSRLFLVPKPGNRWRPVIDLSSLN